MALTPNLTTETVSGTYVDLQGAPIAGQVKFTPRTVLTDPIFNQIIIPNTITVTLDSNGSFSVSLPATDDPDTTPTGFTYRVEESFSGGRTYDIGIPLSSAGTGINLADVVPALPDTGAGATYVLTSQYGTLNSQVQGMVSTVNAATTITNTANTAAASAATAATNAGTASTNAGTSATAATTAASAASAASAAASAAAAAVTNAVNDYVHPFLLMGV